MIIEWNINEKQKMKVKLDNYLKVDGILKIIKCMVYNIIFYGKRKFKFPY